MTQRSSSEPVRIALIGAGNRGQGAYGDYGLAMPQRAKFVAVVEPNDEKRNAMGEQHKIPMERRFKTIPEFFANPPSDIEACIIATLENIRIEPLREAMKHNWHIVVEKPLGRNVEEFLQVYDMAKDYPQICLVCHQLRMTPGYVWLKRLIDSGRYGRIMSIQHSENVCFEHYAHSFVRGNFRNERLAPMLLAKSCHDLDLLSYFIGKPAVRVSSFGSLKYFTPENRPADAPDFCIQNCPHGDTCPYNAVRFYFDPTLYDSYFRSMNAYPYNADRMREVLSTTNYGRCVFACDNNVVDSQSVQIEYEGGINVNFMMTAHNACYHRMDRRLTKISMTNGELLFDLDQTKITAHSFWPNSCEELSFPIPTGDHAGGDRWIMDAFTGAILSGDRSNLVCQIKSSFDGHMLVFAAEKARLTHQVVEVPAFADEIRAKLKNQK